MYQTKKFKTTKRLNDQIIGGESLISVVVDEEINVGDTLLFGTQESHTVKSILENRPAMGNHKTPKTFLKLECDYERVQRPA